MEPDKHFSCIITPSPLSIDTVINCVTDPKHGAISVFIGTVRNQTENKTVERLEYEAFETMALIEMEKICHTIAAQWKGVTVAIHHRYGTLLVGDIAVVIAVSAPHREMTFAACEYAINTLKQTVPIWKKECFTSGDIWVMPHP